MLDGQSSSREMVRVDCDPQELFSKICARQDLFNFLHRCIILIKMLHDFVVSTKILSIITFTVFIVANRKCFQISILE